MIQLDLIEYFKGKLDDDHLKELTKKNYIADLNSFNNFLNEQKDRTITLGDLDLDVLNEYLQFLRVEKKASIKTMKRVKSTFRKLCTYLKNDSYLETNPAFHLVIDDNIYSEPEILEVNESRFILEYIRLKATERDVVVFSLFMNTGIQVHELIDLKKSNIIIAKKAGEDSFMSTNNRVVPLPPKTVDDIKRYEKNNFISNYYFTGQRGPMTNSGIYRIITKYGHFTDLKMNPRIFRNSFINRLYKYNVDENVIRYLTGKELNVYLPKPSFEKIKEAITMCEL
ncbi:tyrosine-type recombinase/integrase [Wukongibacter baidiensis]